MDLYVFDADDTLRRTVTPGQPCPFRPGEWVLMPGVRERLRQIPFGAGARFGLASNQDRVGYGFLTERAARRLLVDLAWHATEGRVTDPLVALCPHRREDDCACRKPRPGMLLGLLGRAGVAAERAIFVGDAETDRLAAAAAGVRFAWARDFFGP